MDMSPGFVLVDATQRVPLVEDVVLPIVEGETVWVIDEPERHFQMEAVVPAVLEWDSFPHLGIDFFFVDFDHLHPSMM